MPKPSNEKGSFEEDNTKATAWIDNGIHKRFKELFTTAGFQSKYIRFMYALAIEIKEAKLKGEDLEDEYLGRKLKRIIG